MLILLLVQALALGTPAAPPAFAAATDFPSAGACRAHLAALIAEARGYEAVRGPYEVAPGDVRIHMVAAEGRGHRIVEHRCLDAALASRSWTHSLEPAEEEFTIESVARSAAWLKHRPGQ